MEPPYGRYRYSPGGQTGYMTVIDLQRFVDAQDDHGTFARALDELAAGRKRSHWMWFVLPQLAGLGMSDTARFFALTSLDEAAAYLVHPVLGPRLHETVSRLLALTGVSATDVLGPVDAMKLRSSMTLFLRADPDDPAFGAVLDRYFDGVPDEATDRLLAKAT
jgi:uncharacterized protein (DUF1810 family)